MTMVGGIRCACGEWVSFNDSQLGELYCPGCGEFVNVTVMEEEDEPVEGDDWPS